MIPQIIYLILMLVALLIGANQHGKPRSNHNFWLQLIVSILVLLLLYWGRFFDPMLK